MNAVVALKHHPPVNSVVWPKTSQLVLSALPASVRHARIYVADTLLDWGIPGLAENAQLVVSELVTNAVRASWQTSGTVAVWLWANRQSLLIEVWDAAPGMPAMIEEPDDECGRGLAIVSALSKSWGYYPDGTGKVVWANLRT